MPLLSHFASGSRFASKVRQEDSVPQRCTKSTVNTDYEFAPFVLLCGVEDFLGKAGMSDSPITAITLSRWLRSSGTLTSGAVVDVRIELEIETLFSTLVFLTATYSPDAPSDLPRHLVVKSPLTTPSIREGFSGEVQFYRLLAPVLGTPPLVRCYAAIEDGDSDKGTLVLEDVRHTHDHPPWPMPPSQTQCEAALDALARIHAQWWEAPALGNTVGQLHTPESLTTMVQGIAAHLPAFIDAVGDALTTEARHLLERVFGSSLKPWMRLSDRRALTIIHGDAHTWNFLFPRSGEGPALLIDWQLWHVDLGARDLAFFIALHWYPSLRREFERPLIHYYHDSLVRQGVEDYSFDELWLDYRRCVVRNLTIPILFWSRGMKPEGWWHRLECALGSYRDLACDELL
jgi:Phosphotransferase enzyme family